MFSARPLSEVDLGDKMTSLQTGVHRGNERLDQFKLLMNWNQARMTVQPRPLARFLMPHVRAVYCSL